MTRIFTIAGFMAGLAATSVAAGEIAEEALTQGDVKLGKFFYDQNCLECHASAEELMERVRGDVDCEQAAWLDGFLINHRVPNESMRRDMIAYLLGL